MDDEVYEVMLPPGHDRNVAVAILSQARLGRNPIDDIQVRHLLAIGYRAGLAKGRERTVLTWAVVEAAEVWRVDGSDPSVIALIVALDALDAGAAAPEVPQ